MSSSMDEQPISIPDTDPPRKRRRKYIAKACNECKRRKIKCNGQIPCLRCGRQDIDCVYADRPNRGDDDDDPQILERLCAQMSAMQDQIASLSATVQTLSRPDVGSQAAARARPSPRAVLRGGPSPREPPFQGPTTSGFGFDLARSSLEQRGIVQPRDASPVLLPPSPPAAPPAPSGEDPLATISKTEALRLCRVYEEEMGIMYPVLDLPDLLHQVELLYSPAGEAALTRDDVDILRLVFACALTAEASGRSELALALFDTVRDGADQCVWGPPDIPKIICLTLVAILYFQLDEETLAWRTIGIVERMCLERGLHRRESLHQPAVIAAGRERVVRLFWSIYVLDMRWSLGTGMPFALEDTDIDPWLPEPEENQTPYLRVMIRYSRLAARVWKFVAAFNNTNEIKKDEMHYLDWQVLRWVADMPDALRLDPQTSSSSPSTTKSTTTVHETRGLRRLRCMLSLRANQLRLLIHRPVLHSAAHIVRYPTESQTVVDIAADTVRSITRLNATSDIYRLQQVTFNYFLVSALAVLFLAVAQTPAQFSARCKDEFYMALELVKGFSSRSYISRRLWTSLRGLRQLGPQLGLQIQPDGAVEGGAPPLPSAPVAPPEGGSALDGPQMTRELMEWFEAVGNLEDQIMGVGVGASDEWMGGRGYPLDYGAELSSVMRDCF
ncbi:C6 transcription factor [Aspergillus taichungensis]|uniref:C6 transcription factor n=1 Tax=Aspergillus taichungensis TaxID=482145 RepID=A0A2J5HTE5_9EURO|nr:C6 transcription factor [Aspergillus taichungensis]